MKHEHADPADSARADWLKRAGLAGTLFFLVKGLLWIIVPVMLAWTGSGGG
jgi:hypothetical protein